jgi:ketosteroid isomerase-like protein
MRSVRLRCWSVAVLLLPTCVLAQSSAAPVAELTKHTGDWCTALLRKDAAMLSALLAPDYVSVGPNGARETRQQALAVITDPEFKMTTCVDSEIEVRVYGDAAVVTGRGKHAGTYRGQAFDDPPALWTDTWIRRDGRWQCVASQATFVATAR